MRVNRGGGRGLSLLREMGSKKEAAGSGGLSYLFGVSLLNCSAKGEPEGKGPVLIESVGHDRVDGELVI